MGRGERKKRKYLVIGLLILLLFLLVDFSRSQNLLQFAYSHFQACLLEYDLALEKYQETKEWEGLENARNSVEHVEHMDTGFLKFHSMSEPLYRKQRTILRNYLRLLAEYSEKLEEWASWNIDVEEQVRILYEGNREMEELLVEDSMDYGAIGRKNRKKVLERIEQMTDLIRKEME